MKIDANGIEIHYQVEGSGPWVTLSHSLACHLGMWDEQVKVLARRYRVLRYDIRGHGRSEVPPGAYGLEQMADDLYELLCALGVGKTHFVGLSMGGMIGQTFALKHPEKLASLTLSSTTSRYPPEARSLWEERIRTVQAQGMEPMVEPTLARWFTEPFRKAHPEVVERIAAMIRATPAQGYIGCCHAIPRIDLTDRLKEIRCPTLVIVGEQDPGTPVAMARAIHEVIAGSELAILPSASHLCNLEQCEAFNRILLAFLDRAHAQS